LIHDLVGEGQRLFGSEQSSFLVERVDGFSTDAHARSGKRPILFVPS
jgi:hypothetical protein